MKSGNDQQRDCQRKEQHAEYNGRPEESFLDATARSEHAAGIGAGQTAQTRTLTLQDDAGDQRNRRYNQSDIQINLHTSSGKPNL